MFRSPGEFVEKCRVAVAGAAALPAVTSRELRAFPATSQSFFDLRRFTADEPILHVIRKRRTEGCHLLQQRGRILAGLLRDRPRAPFAGLDRGATATGPLGNRCEAPMNAVCVDTTGAVEREINSLASTNQASMILKAIAFHKISHSVTSKVIST